MHTFKYDRVLPGNDRRRPVGNQLEWKKEGTRTLRSMYWMMRRWGVPRWMARMVLRNAILETSWARTNWTVDEMRRQVFGEAA